MRSLIVSALLLCFSVPVCALTAFPIPPNHLPTFRCIPDCFTQREFANAGIYEIDRRGGRFISGPVTIVNSKGRKMDVELSFAYVPGLNLIGFSVPDNNRLTVNVESHDGLDSETYTLSRTIIRNIINAEKRKRIATLRNVTPRGLYIFVKVMNVFSLYTNRSPAFGPVYDLNITTSANARAPSFVGPGGGRVPFGVYAGIGPTNFSAGSPDNIVPAMIRAAKTNPVGTVHKMIGRTSLEGISPENRKKIFDFLGITEAYYRSRGGK